jgi:hypothetical protein
MLNGLINAAKRPFLLSILVDTPVPAISVILPSKYENLYIFAGVEPAM